MAILKSSGRKRAGSPLVPLEPKLQRPNLPTESVPRILIIGAGYRGHAYAEPIHASGEGTIAAVIEASAFKRKSFGEKYIWGAMGRNAPVEGEQFADWEDYIRYELRRRERARDGEVGLDPGIDAAFVCVLDELHAPVVKGLAPLGLHIMCEKPLATRLDDVIDMYGTILKSWSTLQRQSIFAAGYVLRYSPANLLLRRLVRDERVVGDVVSVEHTDTVGWWHFAHSYVRGNWRKESTSAPSLLTKSSHDIDFILWLLCSPPSSSSPTLLPPHLPSRVSSVGRVNYFKRSHKPEGAGNATNCLSCPVEATCVQSAKTLYLRRHLAAGKTCKPVNQVVPDIEDVLLNKGKARAAERLLETLSEDYDASTSPDEINKKNWYGRCVFESDNDVCDDQLVTMEWDDDPLPPSLYDSRDAPLSHRRIAKVAQFHMVALTDEVGGRRGRISGTAGEVVYDQSSIRVIDFLSGEHTVHSMPETDDVRLDRDKELTLSFVRAVTGVKRGELSGEKAQRVFLDCTLEDLIRSHLVVFWAEAARKKRAVVGWEDWWSKEVAGRLKAMGAVVRT